MVYIDNRDLRRSAGPRGDRPATVLGHIETGNEHSGDSTETPGKHGRRVLQPGSVLAHGLPSRSKRRPAFGQHSDPDSHRLERPGRADLHRRSQLPAKPAGDRNHHRPDVRRRLCSQRQGHRCWKPRSIQQAHPRIGLFWRASGLEDPR